MLPNAFKRAAARAFATSASKPAPIFPIKPFNPKNKFESFAQLVGNTPLVRLRKASEETGCDIYGKCEFMNPGGSVKDRAGLYMVAQAEQDGHLVPGERGLIVEGTAGNTGIGLTLAANSRGYRTVIVIPETQSQEKKDTLRFAGAQVIEVPAVPYANPLNYVHIAKGLAELLKKELAGKMNVFYANQWDNLANRQAHIEGTSQEIWSQLEGKVDAFSCAMGTGGTLSGCAIGLRQKNPKIFIGLTDPQGALPVNYFTTGTMALTPGSSITEGVGQGRITGNMRDFRPDACWEIPDAEALEQINSLCFEEGLQVGLSTGLNVAGAIRVAKKLGPGHTIVTVLCDGAMRYATKMYNPPFLQSRSLPVPEWLDVEKQRMLFECDVKAAAEEVITNIKKTIA